MPLAEVLSDLYGTQADMRRVLAEAQIEASRIPLGSSAINDWSAALREAARQGREVELVSVPLREYREYPGLQKAVKDWITRPDVSRDDEAERDEEMPPEPRGNEVSARVFYERIAAVEDKAEAGDQRIREKLDTLRDDMVRRDDMLLANIVESRHGLAGKLQPLLLEQPLKNAEMIALREKLDAQQKQIEALGDVNRRMLWFGVTTGVSAVVGQFALMFLARALGWG